MSAYVPYDARRFAAWLTLSRDPVSLSAAPRASGRHDTGLRRRAKRSGRERGCWVYIAAEELARADFASELLVPWYRIWPSSRGGLFVRLYRKA